MCSEVLRVLQQGATTSTIARVQLLRGWAKEHGRGAGSVALLSGTLAVLPSQTLHRFDETPHCSAPVSFYGPVVRCPAEVCTPPLHPLTLLPSSSSQPQGEPQYSFVSTSEAGVMGT